MGVHRGAPFNDTTPMDVVVTPFATGVGGTVTTKWDAPEGNGTTLAAQLTHLLNNRAYINFHTQQFGGGEIRGTIVPEPTSIVLVGVAVVGGLRCAHWRAPSCRVKPHLNWNRKGRSTMEAAFFFAL